MVAHVLCRTAITGAVLLICASALAQTRGVPRTPWGDPDLQGTFTNKDEVGTPFERPDEFQGRRVEDIPPVEVAAILKKRHDDRPGVQAVAAGRIGPTEWQSEVDLARAAARQEAQREGPAASWRDLAVPPPPSGRAIGPTRIVSPSLNRWSTRSAG